MSVPLGALVSKSRRMTLSSCSRDSTVERSSWGMTLEGKTRRPCRLRTKAFMRVLSDTSGSDTSSSDTSGPAGGLLPTCPLHPPLDGGDQPRAQLGGGDDVVHRAHPTGPVDVVDRLEFGGHLTELLGAHAAAQGGELDPQAGLLDALGSGHRGLQLLHPGVGGGPLVDLAGEDDGGGGGPAEHRGGGALDREDLHVLVEDAGEDDEGAAVVAGDHAEDDGAVEVGDGPPDLGAVLQLQVAQRLR